LLLEQDHDVHVLVRPAHDPRPLKSLAVTTHHADLRQPAELHQAVPEVDGIIHAAADTHIGRQPRPIQYEVNVRATGAIAEVAMRRRAKVVFVSSVDALPAGRPDVEVNEETLGDSKFPCGYVTTKRAAEAVLQEAVQRGLNAVIVNPGFMLGPWDWKPSSGRMLLRVATSFTPLAASGGFSICDVRDVAAAIITALCEDTAHRRYILAGENMRYLEAWRLFAKVAGGRGPFCRAGPLMRIMAGKWGDLHARITGREGDINSAAIAMSDLYHYYDSSRAARELGYQMRPPLESTTDAWAWFREYGYAR
jgi:dihydroflavonol-4-reductase